MLCRGTGCTLTANLMALTKHAKESYETQVHAYWLPEYIIATMKPRFIQFHIFL
jgi:hypothetical protein